MSEVGIHASGVGYRVQGKRLLVDVEVSAAPGDHLGILGPNGAGKTTLMRLLAGELQPTEGSIRFGTEELDSIPPADMARRRAVLGTGIPADIPFQVRTVVSMGRYPYRRDPANTREADELAVSEAMARTDVGHLSGRLFATLSSGERSRVSLARVLAQETPILLLDEPTTSLDIGHSELVLRQALQLAQTGRIVISVIHDLNAAAHYCTRLCLLSGGRVSASGTAPDVLDEDLLSDVYQQRLRVIDHPFRVCRLVVAAD